MNTRTLAFLVFLYMLTIQTINVIVGPEFHNNLVLKFTFFELGVMSALGIMFLRMVVKKDTETFINRLFIGLLFTLFIYQIVVIGPLLLTEGYSIKETAYAVFRRSYLLIIPFIYWCILPAVRNIDNMLLLINISGIVLFFAFIVLYFTGYRDYTSTGELRMAPGVTAIIFAFMLITSFSFFSHSRNNYLFILIGVAGMIFANHKSAYLALGVVALISLLNFPHLKNKARTGVQILLLLVLILIPLSQVPLLMENFIGRITSSFTTSDPNASDRIVHYEMAFEYFKEHPINGSKVNTKYYFNEADNKVPPHSFIFQLLATQGLVGFIAHAIILSVILFIGYRNRRDPYSFQMVLLIVFYMIFTSLNVNFFSPRNLLVLMLACAIILYRNQCIENAKSFFAPLVEKMELEKQSEGEKIKV